MTVNRRAGSGRMAVLDRSGCRSRFGHVSPAGRGLILTPPNVAQQEGVAHARRLRASSRSLACSVHTEPITKSLPGVWRQDAAAGALPQHSLRPGVLPHTPGKHAAEAVLGRRPRSTPLARGAAQAQPAFNDRAEPPRCRRRLPPLGNGLPSDDLVARWLLRTTWSRWQGRPGALRRGWCALQRGVALPCDQAKVERRAYGRGQREPREEAAHIKAARLQASDTQQVPRLQRRHPCLR